MKDGAPAEGEKDRKTGSQLSAGGRGSREIITAAEEDSWESPGGRRRGRIHQENLPDRDIRTRRR